MPVGNTGIFTIMGCHATDTAHETRRIVSKYSDTGLSLYYPLWNVSLGATTTQFNVLGLTQSRNPFPSCLTESEHSTPMLS